MDSLQKQYHGIRDNFIAHKAEINELQDVFDETIADLQSQIQELTTKNQDMAEMMSVLKASADDANALQLALKEKDEKFLKYRNSQDEYKKSTEKELQVRDTKIKNQRKEVIIYNFLKTCKICCKTKSIFCSIWVLF